MTSSFQKVVGVERNYTGLIWLGDISENTVDHSDQHAVFPGVTRVFDNWDNVRSLFSNVEQVAARPVRKFDGVNKTLRTNDIRYVRNGRTRSSSEVQNLLIIG